MIGLLGVPLGLNAAPAAPRLDDLLTQVDIWRESSDDFMLRFAPLKFNFVSDRSVAHSIAPNLTLFGMRVYEALAYFEGGKVKRIDISLYNRGDATDLRQADFEGLVERAREALSRWGGAGRSGESSQGRETQSTRRHLWAKPPCAAELSWAYTEPRRVRGMQESFRSDYVRLSLAYTAKGGLEGMSAVQPRAEQRGAVTGYTLRQRVKRSNDGDAVIAGLPMVDQGQKGYCAAATAERLLRYYGRNVDQHVVAQLADTARSSGTSTDGMLNALRSVGKAYQLDVRSIVDFDYKSLTSLINDYNRQAKLKGLPAIMVGNSIDIGAMYNAMDAATLKQTKAKRVGDKGAFFRHIRNYVDAGVPMIWSCMVGKYPENPPLNVNGAYGHIRLIIGYNLKREEIYYTDSWGPGHERKVMPLDDAWAMTFALHLLKPRDIR